MNDTNTTESWAAKGHARLGIAGCVLETLANNLDDVELVTTIRLALKELYAGMTALEDVATLSDDTLDCVMKIRDLSAEKKSGVLEVLRAIPNGGLREAQEAFAPADDHTRGNAIRAYIDSLEQASLRLVGAAGTAEVLGCAFQFGREYAFSDEAPPAACELLARDLSGLKELIESVITEASTIHRADIQAAAAAWIAAEQEANA